MLLLPAGLVEELIFRGVLQKAAVEAFSGWGIVYVSYIFAILHIGWIRAESPLALLDIVFVFMGALFFGWVVKKIRPLFGVNRSHGITNIVLFIIAPFLF